MSEKNQWRGGSGRLNQTAIKHPEGGGWEKKKRKKRPKYKAALSLDSMPNIVEALKLPKEMSTQRHPKSERRDHQREREREREIPLVGSIFLLILGWFG